MSLKFNKLAFVGLIGSIVSFLTFYIITNLEPEFKDEFGFLLIAGAVLLIISILCLIFSILETKGYEKEEIEDKKYGQKINK